jgi:hypothetical protein
MWKLRIERERWRNTLEKREEDLELAGFLAKDQIPRKREMRELWKAEKL